LTATNPRQLINCRAESRDREVRREAATTGNLVKRCAPPLGRLQGLIVGSARGPVCGSRDDFLVREITTLG